jgi:riboflavin synthase
VPQPVLRLCVPKGAITVDGVSLTINEITAHGCRVTIIPHTAKHTTLGIKVMGDRVNLESDVIGKYIDRLLEERRGTPRPEVQVDREYLSRRGLL